MDFFQIGYLFAIGGGVVGSAWSSIKDHDTVVSSAFEAIVSAVAAAAVAVAEVAEEAAAAATAEAATLCPHRTQTLRPHRLQRRTRIRRTSSKVRIPESGRQAPRRLKSWTVRAAAAERSRQAATRRESVAYRRPEKLLLNRQCCGKRRDGKRRTEE